MMPYQLLYSSVATREFDESGLRALLAQARGFNAANGLTGLLIHFAPTREFFQLLEGEPELVLPLMERIRQDSRHERVLIDYEGEARARSFADWTMGFLEDGSVNPQTWPGFVDVFRTGIATEHLTGARSAGMVLLQTTQRTLSTQAIPARPVAQP